MLGTKLIRQTTRRKSWTSLDFHLPPSVGVLLDCTSVAQSSETTFISDNRGEYMYNFQSLESDHAVNPPSNPENEDELYFL